MNLKIKETIGHIVDWMKGGVYITTTATIRTKGPTGTDVGYRAKSIDSAGDVAVQVGAGGVNHGVYSRTLDKWMIYADSTDVYVDNANLTVKVLALSWDNGTAGSALAVARWGKIAMLTIWNPKKLAVGNNIVTTLPAGYRPRFDAILPLIAPTASGTPTNALSLRATIKENGNIEIYNYRSSAISDNTGASGTVTYVVGG